MEHLLLGDALLKPPEIEARHFIEAPIERPIELPESVQGNRIDQRMATALRLSQAVRHGLSLGRGPQDARKPFCRVKVEIPLRNDGL